MGIYFILSQANMKIFKGEFVYILTFFVFIILLLLHYGCQRGTVNFHGDVEIETFHLRNVSSISIVNDTSCTQDVTYGENIFTIESTDEMVLFESDDLVDVTVSAPVGYFEFGVDGGGNLVISVSTPSALPLSVSLQIDSEGYAFCAAMSPAPPFRIGLCSGSDGAELLIGLGPFETEISLDVDSPTGFFDYIDCVRWQMSEWFTLNQYVHYLVKCVPLGYRPHFNYDNTEFEACNSWIEVDWFQWERRTHILVTNVTPSGSDLQIKTYSIYIAGALFPPTPPASLEVKIMWDGSPCVPVGEDTKESSFDLETRVAQIHNLRIRNYEALGSIRIRSTLQTDTSTLIVNYDDGSFSTSRFWCTGENICGGSGTLDGLPGERCGDCGIWACTDSGSIECREDHPNECGGCANLSSTPGDPCGICGTYICDGIDEVLCDESSPNECGGCSDLGVELYSFCGECGRYECDGTERVICVEQPPDYCDDCISHSYFSCHDNDIWFFDSCNIPEEVKVECPYGCIEDRAHCLIPAECQVFCRGADRVCEDYDTPGCEIFTVGLDECPCLSLPCEDECSHWEDPRYCVSDSTVAFCGWDSDHLCFEWHTYECSEGYECVDGECVCIPESHAYIECYNDNLWYYDSCGDPEEIFEECDMGPCVFDVDLGPRCYNTCVWACAEKECGEVDSGWTICDCGTCSSSEICYDYRCVETCNISHSNVSYYWEQVSETCEPDYCVMDWNVTAEADISGTSTIDCWVLVMHNDDLMGRCAGFFSLSSDVVSFSGCLGGCLSSSDTNKAVLACECPDRGYVMDHEEQILFDGLVDRDHVLIFAEDEYNCP